MEYVFIKERHLARIENGETLFYGTDHINSTVLMTNMVGEVVWSGDVSPFGDYRVVDSDSYEEIGLKYSGKDYDELADLTYFNMRWYDGSTGRFCSVDPIKDGLLWYAYCNNNPLRFIDPTGLLSQDPDTYDQIFDDKVDTFGDAAEQAGYESLESALPYITDADGNYVDISGRFDDDWNWVSGSEGLEGLHLQHNPDRMIEWMAEEDLTLSGFDFSIFGTGMTMKGGEANVTFSSELDTFQKTFDVVSGESYGFFTNIGKSRTGTRYTRSIPDDKTQADVMNSFLGYFATVGASIPLGAHLGFEPGYTGGIVLEKEAGSYAYEGSVPSNPWQGATVGGSAGSSWKFNGGVTFTFYSDPVDPSTRLEYWGTNPGENFGR